MTSDTHTSVPDVPYLYNETLPPLFSCGFKTTFAQDYFIGYCVSEKLMVIAQMIMMFLLIYQMYFMYMKRMKVRFNEDLRLGIFALNILGSFYFIWHYGVENFMIRGRTFPIIEIFRFIILLSTCYFYVERASKMIPNSKRIMNIIKVMAIIVNITNIY
jgi:hypothetical protein